jgi:hypothetical protein
MFEYGIHSFPSPIAGKLAKPAGGATEKAWKIRFFPPNKNHAQIANTLTEWLHSGKKMTAWMKGYSIAIAGIFGRLHSAALADTVAARVTPTLVSLRFEQVCRPIRNPPLFDLEATPKAPLISENRWNRHAIFQ